MVPYEQLLRRTLRYTCGMFSLPIFGIGIAENENCVIHDIHGIGITLIIGIPQDFRQFDTRDAGMWLCLGNGHGLQYSISRQRVKTRQLVTRADKEVRDYRI